jgi:hypothetical protein
LARKAPELPSESESELLERFRDFQMIDLRRSKRTAYEKVWFIRRLLKAVGKEPTAISRARLLKVYEDEKPAVAREKRRICGRMFFYYQGGLRLIEKGRTHFT